MKNNLQKRGAFPEAAVSRKLNNSRRRTNNKSWWLLGAAGIFLLTKGKSILALLKFSKFGMPFVSMLVTIGAYALVFPIGFAVGLVIMLLIHEMGHVIAAKRKGLPVSAPVFIPFLGALINMKRHPRDAVTEAYVAFGGPLLGTMGAAIALWLGVGQEHNLLIVIAYVGFFLNLINLLPIHPLDGGRIATAVTRWLWLVGLIGGLFVIIYLRSILFFIIWLLFAWELLQKYVTRRGKNRQYTVREKFTVPVDTLLASGMPLPGEEHRRELPFVTYSTLDGEQKVRIRWETLGIDETVNLPVQGIIERVHVTGIEHQPREMPENLTVFCQIDFVQHVSDRYYEVPAATRWKFGLAYAALAGFLLYMMYVVQNMGISPV
jgi:Zn-dependent protease